MDWDDAYANAAYIPGGNDYPDKWAAEAAAFRASANCQLEIPYGDTPRQRFDLFHPSGEAKGLLIFIHGGYWLRFDKSFWSHLAAGPIAQGWAVAMPSYDLCPEVRITQIVEQMAQAASAAAERVAGPIRIAGHSAGGHLTARLMDREEGAHWQQRLESGVAISPVSDLAPLMNTSMNASLRIDAEEARAQSPIHQPAPNCAFAVWVGADERPVFLDQAKWLAQAWDCGLTVEDGKHHFDVIEGLADPLSNLTFACLGG